jgi:hypothetical protein
MRRACMPAASILFKRASRHKDGFNIRDFDL